MKIYTPELSWHDCQAIYSMDIDPQYQVNNTFSFATGGLDSYIRIWLFSYQNIDINIQFLSELQRHQKSINAIKYSPNGAYMASGDDDGIIIIWERMSNVINDDLSHLSSWNVLRVLRYHSQDICDLCWCPNSKFLYSCGQDKLSIKWEIDKGLNVKIFNNHKNFVQGVCWDPKNKYIASLSRDRTCHIINNSTNNVIFKIYKRVINLNLLDDSNDKKDSLTHMFQDENMSSFFRRLTFSPDGNLLMVPSGCIENDLEFLPVSYIFGRNQLNTPTLDKYSSVISCSPILYKLKNLDAGNNKLINLPYRMIFAIASDIHVAIYDTEQLCPIFIVNNLHYWWISDMKWSKNGNSLVITSTDGYLSIIQFQELELGEIYEEIKITSLPTAITTIEVLPQNSDVIPDFEIDDPPPQLDKAIILKDEIVQSQYIANDIKTLFKTGVDESLIPEIFKISVASNKIKSVSKRRIVPITLD